jgi:hypothetical protein
MSLKTTLFGTPIGGYQVHEPKPSFRYHYPKEKGDKITLGRLERGKAYISDWKHYKEGFHHARTWLRTKGFFGRTFAIGTLFAAWALDTLNLAFAGVWTISKCFFPNANLSGLGRAFHYGVQKSYELSKVAK